MINQTLVNEAYRPHPPSHTHPPTPSPAQSPLSSGTVCCSRTWSRQWWSKPTPHRRRLLLQREDWTEGFEAWKQPEVRVPLRIIPQQKPPLTIPNSQTTVRYDEILSKNGNQSTIRIELSCPKT